METRQTKIYEQPAMDVVELELRVPLLVDSEIGTGGSGIGDWTPGEGGEGEIES